MSITDPVAEWSKAEMCEARNAGRAMSVGFMIVRLQYHLVGLEERRFFSVRPGYGTGTTILRYVLDFQ